MQNFKQIFTHLWSEFAEVAIQFNSKLQSKKAVMEYLVNDEDTHTCHWWASSPMTSWGMRSGHNEAVLKTVCPKGTGVRIPLPAPIKMVYSLWVDLFLLPHSEALESALRANSRGEGFAFERKPSGSLLTNGGAKNLRKRRIPLFQAFLQIEIC